MYQHDAIVATSRRLAAAIGRRDLNAIQELLAPGFVHRVLGGDCTDSEAFLRAIAQIPGEILSVTLEQVVVDLSPTGALVTGVQYARVQIDGRIVEDRRAFVDWFVATGADWRIQAAVDLPHQIAAH